MCVSLSRYIIHRNRVPAANDDEKNANKISGYYNGEQAHDLVLPYALNVNRPAFKNTFC